MKGHNTAGNGVSNAVPNKKSYSVAEIQQILGISRPTAYNLIRQNYFQSVRVGSSIRIIKSSFDAWLDTAM
jgi:excisionase family DNA binding protein